MRIAHISDSHICLPEPVGGDRLGDLRRNVDAVNALNSKVDLVVHGGDVAHNATLEEYHAAKAILDGLDAPYYVIPGNRDRRKILRSVFADHLGINAHERFIQYEINTGKTKLIMLDTLDEGERWGTLCADRLADLEARLAADPTKPTAIFMHHPPFDIVQAPHPCQFDSAETLVQFADILNKNQPVLHKKSSVLDIFCGHSHRIVKTEWNNIRAVSLTAMATDLRFGTYPETQKTAPIFNVYEF